MLFTKRPKYRSFDYQPRHYKPEEDEAEKRKKRLGFRYNRASKKKGKSAVFYVLILFILVIIYFYLNGV